MKLTWRLFAVFAGLASAGSVFAETPASSAPLLGPFVEKHELAGAVALVADKDKVLSVEAVGFADVAKGRAMKTDAVFWIASQSKPMTATAVMMLVDEGKIALDDPVEKYLPEFRGQKVVAEEDDDHTLFRKPAHPINILEMLSHISGLPSKSAIEEPTLDGLPLAAALRSYAMTPLQAEPGTHYQYSNAGINTAARVIEVVAGMKYEEFMQQRLFRPLGMKDTTFWQSAGQARRVAKSYHRTPRKQTSWSSPSASSPIRSPTGRTGFRCQRAGSFQLNRWSGTVPGPFTHHTVSVHGGRGCLASLSRRAVFRPSLAVRGRPAPPLLPGAYRRALRSRRRLCSGARCQWRTSS
jgi:CubicO group peptidase (beta-lactamase class C family)